MIANTVTDVTLGSTLYDVLTKNTNILLKPDIFTNEYEYKNGMLVFRTAGVRSTSFVHSFKFYIPFSSSGTVIPEYNNGVYTVYPGYNILVIESPRHTSFGDAKIVGAYAMNSMKFRQVTLNEDLEEIPVYKLRDDDIITVTRYVPKDIEMPTSMIEFFNSLKKGDISVNW